MDEVDDVRLWNYGKKPSEVTFKKCHMYFKKFDPTFKDQIH